MQITWYGHACFLFTADSGARFLTDPCDPSVGYPLRDIAADAVTVSHSHHDHNYLAAVAGNPVVIDTAGEHSACGVTVTGFSTWHDDAQGKKRGANILYLFDFDGIRLLHLGDLGHLLSPETIADIGPVDVLLCPVGGNYTIDALQAQQVASQLSPQVFIPMHYATNATNMDIAGIDDMLRLTGTRSVHRIGGSTCTIAKDALGEKRILILDYMKG